ncbi:hypothetical protein FKW77_008533 [Venturia effusa]|uniref:Uncharacterized protein n=1 Tax=Venturia effusa TaxID=50376 RepID=A0A517LJD0_9PEZI|nr:hypothetical protein FKW77_008533 [Venturia effusa]
MLAFPDHRQAWRLDIVSILAVLGENNIKFNAHLINLSWTCLLPRLLPAPQGLLSERMKILPYEEDVIVYSPTSGTSRTGLNYFANLMHGDGSREPLYTTRELRVWRMGDSRSGRFKGNAGFKLKSFGPLNVIAVVSCLMSLGLLGWAVRIGDGVATVGIVVMSLAAPFLCIGTRWELPPLEVRHRNQFGPPADVVIRNREGTFTVVRCTEEVARALYFTPEQRVYRVENWVGIATGAFWTMQLALGVAYAVLNVAYWFAAVLTIRDPELAWDFSWLGIEEVGRLKSPARDEGIAGEAEGGTEQTNSFELGLFYAIRLLKSTKWVRETGAVPRTEAWDEWLHLAHEHLDDETWDAKRAAFVARKEMRDSMIDV